MKKNLPNPTGGTLTLPSKETGARRIFLQKKSIYFEEKEPLCDLSCYYCRCIGLELCGL